MERSVVAVIVTYNRLDYLKKSVAAVMAQSFPICEVILVDNKSTDGTPKFLQELERCNSTYPIRVVNMEKNEGGAGGFARGIEEAYERGADLIWLMDDDCVAYHDALEKLVRGFDALTEKLPVSSAEQSVSTEPGFVCSNVRWKDGEVCEMNIPRATGDWSRYYLPESPYVRVNQCSFVSVLVNARAVSLVGYPVREFFIWLDDVEFSGRIAERCPGFVILDSLVVHDIPQNTGVHFGDVSAKNVWKYRYGIRNEVAYLASRPLGVLKAARYIVSQLSQMSANKVPFSLRAQILFAGLSGFTFCYKSKIRLPAARSSHLDVRSKREPTTRPFSPEPEGMK
ncbi:glycosyltransferase family 2 protein [Sinorhizobium meliloti]|uniref:glycosyltransferase family 2 protein n=1 Tax=Rhizobium meliloti TaxID=382 RepID=UPI000FDC8916|nr:glycosyltransferase family 2 protein [Sinorhizobium meliloti]RVQ54375.1 glycosyltransferase [Sinorhizobium meliloti]